MKYDPISRRFFIRGMGGFLLSVPAVPSIVEMMLGKAVAQQLEAHLGAFVFFRTYYGMMAAHRHPAENGFNMVQNDPPIRIKKMADIQNGYLNDHYQDTLRKLALEDYATLMLGVTSHHTCDHITTSVLCGCDSAEGRGGTSEPSIKNSSIDVHLSNSNTLYPQEPHLRAIRLRPGGRIGSHSLSFSWEHTPGTGFAHLPYENDMKAAFSKIFMGAQNDAPAQNDNLYKKGVMDLVHKDYKKLVQKVSSSDRPVLEQYADEIQDLSRKIAETPAAGMCTVPSEPTFDGTKMAEQYYTVAAKMTALAVQCGLSRVVCIDVPHYQSLGSFASTIHGQSHATKPDSDNAKAFLKAGRFSRDQILKFVSEFKNTVASDGKDLLHHSLMLHTSEMSWSHHGDGGLPHMIFGKLNGKINSGHIIDYRMKDSKGEWWSRVGGGVNSQHGVFGWVPYPRLLQTFMRLGGLNDSQYLIPGTSHYGQITKYSYAVENVKPYHTPANLKADPPYFLA